MHSRCAIALQGHKRMTDGLDQSKGSRAKRMSGKLEMTLGPSTSMATVRGMFPFFSAGREEAIRKSRIRKECNGVCFEVDGFESTGL
jgi:hypothetical protein